MIEMRKIIFGDIFLPPVKHFSKRLVLVNPYLCLGAYYNPIEPHTFLRGQYMLGTFYFPSPEHASKGKLRSKVSHENL